MSLEGVEVAVKITGAAAKEIAQFLIAALKNDGKNLKTSGRAHLGIHAEIRQGVGDFLGVRAGSAKIRPRGKCPAT
jgi:hypothetical protein